MTIEEPAIAPAAPRKIWNRKAWKDMSARERATGCGGAIALLFLCGLCAQIVGNDDDSGEARPTAAARATSDPSILHGTQTASAATRAAKQVDTDATQAARPTATDRPTEDPEAAAVREYVAWVGKQITGMQPAVSGFAERMVEAGEDPTAIFSDRWKLQVAAALVVFTTSADEIRAYDDVPEGGMAMHGMLTDLADQLDIIAEQSTKGIDEIDVAALQKSNEAMAELSRITTEMSKEIERLAEKYPTPAP